MKFFCDVSTVFVVILIVMLAQQSLLISDDSDYEDYTDDNNKKGKDRNDFRGSSGVTCPTLTLTNGRVRLRSRGRIAKFLCRVGYQALGKRFATCIRGHWNAQPPICISRGCPIIFPPSNGVVSVEYRGALVNFACYPGFSLIGSKRLYCDGKKWNSTVAKCEVSIRNPQLSCDFEREDLCGWTHDPNHDFDWIRFNLVTPSSYVGTGPSYDHTLGQGRDGFYMYIETSSPRVENDTARLYSPVYTMLHNETACFRYWYHMYGATIGYLRVYVKPTSKEFSNLLPSFSLGGDQGDRWHPGFVSIGPQVEPFQVVIEGIRGPSYKSDIAIDDVQLMVGSNCSMFNNMTLPTPDSPNAKQTSISEDESTEMPSLVTDLWSPDWNSYPLTTSSSPNGESNWGSTMSSTQTSALPFTTTSLRTSSITTIKSAPSTSSFPYTTTPTSLVTSIPRVSSSTLPPQRVTTVSRTLPPLITISSRATYFPYASSTLWTTRPSVSSSSATVRPTFNLQSHPTTVIATTKSTYSSPATYSKVTFVPTVSQFTSLSPANMSTSIRPMLSTPLPTTNMYTSRTSTISSFSTRSPKPNAPSTVLSIASKKLPPPLTTVVSPPMHTSTESKVWKTPSAIPSYIPTAVTAFSTTEGHKSFATLHVTTNSPEIKTTSAETSWTKDTAFQWHTMPWTSDSNGLETVTEQVNEIDIFPQDMETPDEPNHIVRPPPPWTYMKRPDTNEMGIKSGFVPCNVAAPQLHKRNATFSTTTIWIGIGAMMAVVVISTIVQKTYNRRKSKQDCLTEDSEIRYLKDGEVQVEFCDLNLRYVGHNEDSGL